MVPFPHPPERGGEGSVPFYNRRDGSETRVAHGQSWYHGFSYSQKGPQTIIRNQLFSLTLVGYHSPQIPQKFFIYFPAGNRSIPDRKGARVGTGRPARSRTRAPRVMDGNLLQGIPSWGMRVVHGYVYAVPTVSCAACVCGARLANGGCVCCVVYGWHAFARVEGDRGGGAATHTAMSATHTACTTQLTMYSIGFGCIGRYTHSINRPRSPNRCIA